MGTSARDPSPSPPCGIPGTRDTSHTNPPSAIPAFLYGDMRGGGGLSRSPRAYRSVSFGRRRPGIKFLVPMPRKPNPKTHPPPSSTPPPNEALPRPPTAVWAGPTLGPLPPLVPSVSSRRAPRTGAGADLLRPGRRPHRFRAPDGGPRRGGSGQAVPPLFVRLGFSALFVGHGMYCAMMDCRRSAILTRQRPSGSFKPALHNLIGFFSGKYTLVSVFK